MLKSQHNFGVGGRNLCDILMACVWKRDILITLVGQGKKKFVLGPRLVHFLLVKTIHLKPQSKTMVLYGLKPPKGYAHVKSIIILLRSTNLHFEIDIFKHVWPPPSLLVDVENSQQFESSSNTLVVRLTMKGEVTHVHIHLQGRHLHIHLQVQINFNFANLNSIR